MNGTGTLWGQSESYREGIVWGAVVVVTPSGDPRKLRSHTLYHICVSVQLNEGDIDWGQKQLYKSPTVNIVL